MGAVIAFEDPTNGFIPICINDDSQWPVTLMEAMNSRAVVVAKRLSRNKNTTQIQSILVDQTISVSRQRPDEAKRDNTYQASAP
ncbi:hypothetical protein Leryth_015740 [Lithospermum erythrorhizon]|nr:hypothetical protein Leryth_015740 [Lithospermum erythrorhizon]